MTQTTM